MHTQTVYAMKGGRELAQESVLRAAETLFHPLRYKIVEALRTDPKGLYINELADLMKADRQLVSFHLLTLASGGYVQGEYKIAKKPASKGKAVKVYRLTAKVEEAFKAIRKELDPKSKPTS